jgi:hypothetical protein
MPAAKQSWPVPAPVSDAALADAFRSDLLWFVHFHDLIELPVESLSEKVLLQLEKRLSHAKSLMPEEFPDDSVERPVPGFKKSGEPKKKPGPKRKRTGGNGAAETTAARTNSVDWAPLVHRIADADGDDIFGKG